LDSGLRDVLGGGLRDVSNSGLRNLPTARRKKFGRRICMRCLAVELDTPQFNTPLGMKIGVCVELAFL
jgi:hypothetical protein